MQYIPGASNAPLISVPAAAGRLGIAIRTVYLLVARGDLAACRIGRRVLIPVVALEQFIARHTSKVAP